MVETFACGRWTNSRTEILHTELNAIGLIVYGEHDPFIVGGLCVFASIVYQIEKNLFNGSGLRCQHVLGK
jgi:hypothetical protein